MKKRNNRSGFTLVEILVVLAISMILMGLLIAPVLQSFNLMRRAQAMADAQDSARHATHLISRDLGQAMFVYENASIPVALHNDGTTDLAIYPDAATPIMLPVLQPDGSVQGFVLPFAKIDFILPKITMHCNAPEGDNTSNHEHPADQPRSYPRGMEAWPPCPICGSTEVEARPKLPLEQDVTVVRYFLALRYNNPDPGPDDPQFGWRSPWARETPAGEGNQVVLYRAEFSPYDESLFPNDMTVEEKLADPIFFYRNAPNPDGEPFCVRWQRVSRVIGLGKYEDLVVAASYRGKWITSIKPCITFRTSAVDNDTFAGTYASDRSFEYPDAVPTVFRATYGYWTPDFRVTAYRDDYKTAFSTAYEGSDLVIHKWVYDPAGGGWTEYPHFNISEYLATGQIVNQQNASEPVEMAFTIDPNSGTVNFSLQPPRAGGARSGPVCMLDPAAINADYRANYRLNRVAIRSALLATFDSANAAQYLANARIVPGSEQVVGPDMTPNAAAGNLVRYERVPLALGDAGLNQYKIDYDGGVIYFSPAWDQDIPVTGEIQVYYRVQFNRTDDVVRGDYSTKALIDIHMEMRMFDPESGLPHPVVLNDSVKVRNALR